MSKTHRSKTAVLLAAAVAVAACGTYSTTRRAEEAARVENWDAAVYHYLEALAKKPEDLRLKMSLQRARQRAGEAHFRKGLAFRDAGDLQRAVTELQLAVQLDPTHQYAEVELGKARKDLAILAQEGGASKLEQMKKAAAEMKVKPPILNPASDEPISLSFPNQTNVRDIYKAIGQAFGINILFDSKLKDNKITIELKDVTARQALETVMQAATHFYKVIDDRSVLIVEDTPQNRRDYEDLVVKTFFLSNADVKDVNNMLRALIDARRIAVNERLNSIVIRDTADKVAIAERLINANDKAKAEVLVDVELIQLDSNAARKLGVAIAAPTPDGYPISFDPTQLSGSATNFRIPLDKLGDITRSMWGITMPSVTLQLVKSSGEAETLAQPQLRITEGEKGNLVIGDRVPIPTTTFNTTQTQGGNIVPITAFQYQDVGIKIDLEPRVHHNNEVTMKLKVEVSELGDKVDVGGGNMQPKIGTRSIDSVIRLKDGETSMLAGLLKYRKGTSRSGLPFLADLPIVGPLFRGNTADLTQTELVLTITPHIIRNPNITEEDLAPVWVGTENRITVFGNSPRIRSAVEGGPFGEAGPAPEPMDDPGMQEKVDEGERGERRPRLAFPPPERQGPARGGIHPVPKEGKSEDEERQERPEASTLTLQAAEIALSRLAFYPSRLPVVVGSEGVLTVVLDAGAEGVASPLHFAYDPARLEVVRVEGGDLPGDGRNLQVQPIHTPALGWITAGWSGQARGSGTLLRVTVRPRQAGELPFIFAGPVGAVSGSGATILGVASAAVVTGVREP
ncbi:MAG TPA: secretin N-terminal domain-containing protein [Thermoanaerobaculaceae bacterium]|nr:secretin N-terminal domain-containing protein [Thermoanaerobaculaceae bacterium]HRS16097.1 secretin N-terminal domain-containing protein [Thermoanaerobaculaceae bacterium]